ncbi:dihydropteroate synthase [Tepidiphilus sp. J10]|uniref:dihydropteroate synthase n=1 Tax=Tepidiphilus sp. J10 TaxID=2502185 RepID=UPI00115C676A|nr:dihydropteroate synthase [Tepidiphilus sp. J10]
MRWLQAGRFRLDLSEPKVMGIVNLTEDSFSGDGLGAQRDRALRQADAFIAAGVDLLDFGAESTRPGAEPVPAEQELERLLPVLEALKGAPVPLSVDTMKPEVMREVLRVGADLINDVAGFRLPGAIEAVAASDCALCVMHMKGEPRTMQHSPVYTDVLAEVEEFLEERTAALQAAGVARERILWDPGFGFGKTLEHNAALFRALPRLAARQPLLVGVSRKTMIGQITGRPVGERLAGSLTAAVLAWVHGAAIVRVHDVAATVDAREILRALGPSSGDATTV